jgi:parallel beta-helix repeat protein
LLMPALGIAGSVAAPAAFAPTIFKGTQLTPDDDLGAILAAAIEGETFELGPGTFELRQGVTLRCSVTLNGAGRQRTHLVCRGADYILRVVGVGRFSAQGIGFKHLGRAPADIVWILRGHAELTECSFEGAVDGPMKRAPRTQNAPAGRQGGRGLWFGGDASGAIQRCHFLHNEAGGVEVGGNAILEFSDCVSRGNRGAGLTVRNRAKVTLQNNQFIVNFLSGLVFDDASTGQANQNNCSQNGLSGVAVLGSATPNFQGNSLRANQRGGMAFWQYAGGEAADNVIEDNQGDGIEVLDNAAPILLRNILSGNTGSGLSYSDHSRGMALQNECLRNGGLGIALGDDATPTMGGNQMGGNGAGDTNTFRART